MTILKIDELAPDMVVLRDVKDRNGRLLVASGTALSAKHLTMLRAWGVVTIEVVSEGESDGEKWDPATLAAAEARIQELYKRADKTDPLVKELMRLSLPFVARAIEAGKGGSAAKSDAAGVKQK